MNHLLPTVRQVVVVASLWFATYAAEASHFRGASASYTISAAGVVTVDCFSVWRSDAVGGAAFQMRTGLGGGGSLLGNFTTTSTINPYSTGTEFGGGGFTVVRQTFTFNLASPARPSGFYYARWTSCCRVAGIKNAPESTWAIELKIAYTAGQASAGPTMIPATIDIIGRGFDYNQNLNSADPDGTPVAYQFITGAVAPDFGPSSSIPGISLSSIGTVSISAANTASLALGRWVYKVRVTDGSGATAERDVLVAVQDAMGNLPPVLGSIGSKTVPVNTPLTFPVSGTDPNFGQTLTVRAQRIPPGASFPQASAANSVSRTFNWTPTTGQEGTYLVNFEVFDNATTILIDNELVQITVTGANNPPVLNPVGNQTVPNGGTLTFAISGSDPDAGQTVSFEAFNLPAGATFDPSTRTFTWTPAAAQYDATFTGITFRIRDNGTPNLVDDETISLTVGAGNQAPVIAPVPSQTIVAGQTLQFSVTATDGNSGQTILLTPGSGGLPLGATFPIVSGPSSGPVSSSFNWTPGVAQIGNHSVRFRAEDNGSPILNSELVVSIQVTPANLPPTDLTLLPSAVPENEPIGTIVGLLSAADPDAGDTHTYTLVSGTGDDGNVAFAVVGDEIQTAAVFDFETQDTYTIRVRTTDNEGASFEEAFTVSVSDVNEAPADRDRGLSVYEDSGGGQTQPTHDVDGDPITYLVVSAPAHGSVIGTNPLIYVPAPNYNGPDSYTFKATDGLLESPVYTYTITVLPVNDAPVIGNALPDSVTGTYGNEFFYGPAANTFMDVDAAQVLTWSATGMPPGITFNPATRTFSGTPTVSGTFAITVTATDNGTPAASVADTFDLVISKAALSVAAASTSRSYGIANPSFTGTLTGVVNGDNITATYSTTATPASPVGPYAISPALNDPDGKLANYTATVNAGTLTVTPAPLEATTHDASRVYGDANPVFTGTAVGLKNGDNITVSGWSAGPASAVGTYSIVPVLNDPDNKQGNYSISYGHGTLTVTPAPLEVTTHDASRVYGDANPVFTGTAVGLKNGDNITVSGWSAGPASAVGTYSIVPVLNDPDNKQGNYNISYGHGTLTVTPAPLEVTTHDASRVYGDANPVFTGTAVGLKNGDNITVSGWSAGPASAVGTYSIVPVLNDPDSKQGNYNISYGHGTLTVTPAPLLVVAADVSRAYGNANPAFTGSLTGVVGGDNITADYSTVATALSPVGTYSITPSLNDPNGKLANYAITSNDGTLTINPAIASVAAKTKSKTYGEVDPPLDAVVTGEVPGGDTIVYTLDTTALPLSNVGGYPITVTLGSNPNYAVTPTDATLTVNAAFATVAANAKTKVYGEANPTLDAVVSGEVAGGDPIAYDLDTTATQFSDVGSYPITVTPGGNPNYSVSLVHGTLTVTPAPLEVTIHNPASGLLQTINTPISFTGSFTLTGNPGPYAAHWMISSATVPETAIPATISGTTASLEMQFPTPGVYLVRLIVEDAAGTVHETELVENDLLAYVVIYDPNGGFVTGGGWINSPAGAFHPDLQEFAGVAGKATFGFVAKYQKGANTPTGNTEFQFKAGSLNFKSVTYQWLTVAGARAQYKGWGTVNGEQGYSFMLTAVDGDLLGSGLPDRFRMKIWATDTSVVIYDNQSGSAENSELTDGTIIGGGSIVIHKTK